MLMIFTWVTLQLCMMCAAARSTAFVPNWERFRFRHRITSSCMVATTHHDNVDIPIIYENDKLLAINKPPGIPYHDDPALDELGILSLIRLQQQQANPTFAYPDRLYGVHRLDKVTSGILLFAKDATTASALMKLFSEKKMTKFYTAISAKKPKKKKQGWVKGTMAIGRRGSYKLLSNTNQQSKAEGQGEGGTERKSKDKRGGYAETRFYTAGLGNLSLAPPLQNSTHIPKCAILFQPHTGKTHQLRVAAKSVAIPILGDSRYSGGKVDISTKEDSILSDDAFEGWDRTYLHAAAIHFELSEDELVTIWCPPPFNHLFSETELSDVYIGMMEKYCNCNPILEAIHCN